MKRLAALVAAVAMVAGAWAVRAAVIDDEGAGGAATTAPLRLTCATELATVCRTLDDGSDALELTIEDPGRTADRLTGLAGGSDPGFDAWLVDGPWAAMVADDRAFGGAGDSGSGAVLGTPSAVLGRSPGVIVVQSARQQELAGACGGTITWRCVGEQAGSLRVGLTPPDRGDGLVTLAEATAGYFGSTDYSSGDFEDPGFVAWFDALTRLGSGGGINLGARSALATAVGQSGTFNVVGALEAQATALLRGRRGWSTIYPDPMSTAEVQLVPRAGAEAEGLLDRLGGSPALGRVLAAEGWRSTDDGTAASGSAAPASTGVPLPDSAGLPSAGVLNALRDLW